MKFQIHSFGCKVNTYDSGLVQKNMARHGFVSSQDADSRIHVLNTCAVTSEATKEAVRLIRRLKAKDPFSTVVVTGCAAQVDTDSFADLPGADLIVANSHKGELPRILDQHFKGTLPSRILKSNIFRKEDLEAGGGLEESHSRAFLKIQDGCNSFCSYCIIPYARGKSRSIPIKDLVLRVNELALQGIEEFVLTGVHIGDYQDESRPEAGKLEDLIEVLLEKTKVQRFRLTSLEPVEVSERLLNLYASERLCRHFHMSIQSAATPVLKDMKRQYGEAQVRESLQRIRERLPGAFIGMDVIAGFPTETEELFEQTYRVLDETPWTRLHVFPYSERKGTRAETFVQLPMEVRKARARRLRELSLSRFQSEARQQLGQQKQILLLRSKAKDPGVRLGISRDYWNIRVEDATPQSPDPAVSSAAPLVGGESELKIIVTGYQFEKSPRMEGLLTGRIIEGVAL